MSRLATALAGIAATTAAVSLAFATPAEAAVEGTVRGAGAPGAIADSFIVVLKDKRATPDLAGLKIRERFGTVVPGFSAQMSAAAARRLAADPRVSYVEQDRLVTVEGTQANPPSWGLDRIDQKALPLNKSYTAGSAANVTAYVIDTGIRLSHTDFGGRARSGWDFVDNDANAADCQGHGTHVAGTVGGATYGVAKDVKLVSVRVLDCNGRGSFSRIIAGVDWVTANAVKPAVVNMSLSGDAGATLDTAVKNSIAAGITYAVAAGNDSKDACTKSPARLPEAITVGATDETDARASFSNFGSCLDVFAPGKSIRSALSSGDGAAGPMSGTSMASPHVAGVAALVLGANPAATPAQVRDAIVAGAGTGRVTGAGSGSPTGLLHSNVSVAPAACPTFTNSYAKAVGDLATVDSNLTVSGCPGRAPAAATLTVDIAHADRGDLALTLLAPDGTQYAVKTATAGDDVANLTTSYRLDLSTEDRDGTWKLRIADSYAGDTGTLRSWSLGL